VTRYSEWVFYFAKRLDTHAIAVVCQRGSQWPWKAFVVYASVWLGELTLRTQRSVSAARR